MIMSKGKTFVTLMPHHAPDREVLAEGKDCGGLLKPNQGARFSCETKKLSEDLAGD